MPSPADSFLNWIQAHEIENAVPSSLNAEKMLGLTSTSMQAEVKLISDLLDRRHEESDGVDYSWARDAKSFCSVADAHFQYLTIWFAAFVESSLAHLAPTQMVTVAGVLRDRKRTPFTEQVSLSQTFVAIPIGFIASVDLFFRTHFRLRDIGVQISASAVDRCIESNAIGGQAIESAIRYSEDKSFATLLQLESGYMASELFDPDISSDAIGTKRLDFYNPDLSRSTAQVFHDLTGRGGQYVSLDPSTESQAASYLCVAFGLFHELSHQLVGGDGILIARALGFSDSDEANAIESAVDFIALSAYLSYVDSASRELTVNGLIEAIIHPARYTLGPSGFHSVGKAIQLAEWIFYETQGESEEHRARRNKNTRLAIACIQKRNVALAEKLLPLLVESNSGTLDQWHILAFGALLEVRCIEVALRMKLDRGRGYRSQFCDLYNP
jgi:hypothetical protein